MKDNKPLLLAAFAGIALYFFTKDKAQSKPPEITLHTSEGKKVISTASLNPTTAKAAAPVVKKPTAPVSNLADKWIFVSSLGGETIFEGVNSTKSIVSGYGKNAIVRIPNDVELGVATGKIENGMIQVRAVINGQTYLFWVDSTQVRPMDTQQKDYFISVAKTGRKKSRSELDAIVDYFFQK